MKFVKFLALFLVSMVAFACSSDGDDGWFFIPPLAPETSTILSVDNETLAFGSVVLNTTKGLTVVVSNNGTAELTGLTRAAITGTNANEFTKQTDCDVALAAGANCNVVVTFAPTTDGAKTGTLAISSANGGNQSVTLTGTSSSTPTAILNVDNTTLAFGSVVLNTTKGLTVVVSNTGTTELTDLTIGAITGTNANEFTKQTDCGVALAAGANCNVVVTFAPTTDGAKAGTLAISSANGGNQSVTLTGTVTGANIGFANIYTGMYHAFAGDSNGKLYAWGSNNNGQLGVNDTANKNVPTLVSGQESMTFTDVYAGQFHTLAKGTGGKLYAWGYNDNSQLGDGTKTNRSVPTLVAGQESITFTDVYGSLIYTLAKGSDGKLYAWGYNNAGQLGVNDTADKNVPTLVSGQESITFTDVYVGRDHTLAKSSDGKLYAWGLNGNGQLGTGGTANKSVPTLVLGQESIAFTDVYAGVKYTIARDSNGKLYAWGLNNGGQLGVDDTADKDRPTLVTLPNGVDSFADVYFGRYHALAKGNNGKLYAWGRNSAGQLGDGTEINRSMPTLVSGQESITFTDVYVGEFHTTAKDNNDKLYAWGDSSSGQLGVSNSRGQNIPTLVTMPNSVNNFTNVYSSQLYTLAKGSDSKLYAWGSNSLGELGVGDTTSKNVPTLVTQP